MHLICAALLCSCAGAVAISSGALAVSMVDAERGSFTVSVDDEIWFTSAPIEFSANNQTFSTADGGLKLSAKSNGTGTDGAGAYSFLRSDWKASTPGGAVKFATVIKGYTTGRSNIVFQSIWPDGAQYTQGSSFPGLVQETDQLLGHLEYTGSSCGFMVSAKGNLGISGGKGKGLIAIVPHATSGDGPSASLALGPVTEHFANQGQNLDGGLGYGLSSTFTFTPPGYTLETVLVATSKKHPSPGDNQPERTSIPTGGANAALAEYGDYVLARHDKTRAGPNITNEVAHIGYSTTGFYFYNFCDCLDTNFTHKSKTCNTPAPSLPVRPVLFSSSLCLFCFVSPSLPRLLCLSARADGVQTKCRRSADEVLCI
jgi:hypothetical protein